MPINTFKQDEETVERFKAHLFLRLIRYLKPYKKTITAILALIGFILISELIVPFFFQVAIDVFVEERADVAGLIWSAGGVTALCALAAVAFRKRLQLMARVSNRVLYQIRQDLYEHLQTLSFRFFDNRPAGKILARVIGDVNSLRELLNQSVLILIPNTAKLLCVAVIMLAINLRLAVYALVMLPLLALALSVIQRKAHKGWRAYRKKTSNLNAFTHEAFSGSRVVMAQNAEGQMKRTFRSLAREQRKAFVSACRFSDLFWPCVELSWGAGSIIVYWAGAHLLGLGDEITVGVLVSFSTYIAMFWQPIMNLSSFYNNLITNLAAAERIFEIMDTPPDVQDAPDAVELPPIQGEVVFSNVTFGYETDTPVLHDFSFKAEAGRTIALVGATGAGKTSIINLLGRFYDIQAGTITVDGYDVSKVTLQSLRGQMGVMPQDTFLFSGTIRENIRYGKLSATDEEIEAAAKAVHAHAFIMALEQGYDTDIMERGGRLSAGQRQLIAFARAMLSDPRILVLDEATASIDTHTERLVQAGIRELLAGRTNFIIAHRLSTIRRADCILVIDSGRLVESGTHEELMEQKGAYYNLYMAQFERVAG